MNGKNNQSSTDKELNLITNQILDTNLQKCHLKSDSENTAEIETDSLNQFQVNSNKECISQKNSISAYNKTEEKTSLHPLTNDFGVEQCIDLNCSLESYLLKSENSKEEHKVEFNLENVTRHLRQRPFPGVKIQKTQQDDKQISAEIKLTDLRQSNSKENIREPNSSSFLPYNLTSLNKSEADDERRKSDSLNSNFGCTPMSKPMLTQTGYLPNELKSEALLNEMETELKQLKNLHSLQSIYKFAYDENVTDQSDAGSKSPSPLDPESNVPSSLTSAEILIHEADSGSDVGSEDVELLPHRYESETYLSENKHMYVNKLSLAVELLRTQETLPYDDEFKRVTSENKVSNTSIAGEKIEVCLVEDLSISKTLTSQSQVKQTFKSSSSNSRPESFEGFNLQEDTEAERRGNRKFGIHQYISPKRAASMDPWTCCIIM